MVDVEVGTGTAGSRFLKNDWPSEEGLILGTTKLSDEPNLVPEEIDLTLDEQWGGL